MESDRNLPEASLRLKRAARLLERPRRRHRPVGGGAPRVRPVQEPAGNWRVDAGCRAGSVAPQAPASVRIGARVFGDCHLRGSRAWPMAHAGLEGHRVLVRRNRDRPCRQRAYGQGARSAGVRAEGLAPRTRSDDRGRSSSSVCIHCRLCWRSLSSALRSSSRVCRSLRSTTAGGRLTDEVRRVSRRGEHGARGRRARAAEVIETYEDPIDLAGVPEKTSNGGHRADHGVAG